MAEPETDYLLCVALTRRSIIINHCSNFGVFHGIQLLLPHFNGLVYRTAVHYFNSVHCYGTCSNFQMEGFEKMIFENKAVIATQQCI